MNRLYLRVPLALLGLFAVPYGLHLHEAEQTARARETEDSRRQKAAEEEKKTSELKARADADQRAAARTAAEQQAAAAKRAQWDADSRRIADETAGYREAAAKLTTEIAELQSRLEAARTARAKLNDEVFATAKAVELAHIDQRNAEMEIKRLTAMLAHRAADTELPPLSAP